jgi:phage repressor protein C with HTH and peptisase S24 domain
MNNIVTQRFIKCHDKLRDESRVRSSRQFALTLDYLPQSLSEILKGRRDVTIELLRKAVEKYKINPVYIFTGEGPMFMMEEDHKDFRVLTIVTNVQEDERILHVPIPAQSGYAADLDDPSFVENLPTYTLPDYKYKVGTHRSFDVSGDNMEPALFEGDKVVCSFLEPTLWETAIKDNYVYVLVTRADILVGRVVNHLKTDKRINLLSDNSFYEPKQISIGDIREIWYVRAKICPFLPSVAKNSSSNSAQIGALRKKMDEQSEMIFTLQESIQQLVEQITQNVNNNGKT